MKILALAINDLEQIFRDKRTLLFLAVMPIGFTMFMGFMYSRSGEGEPQETRLSLAWVENEPVGKLSQMLYAHLAESEALKLQHMEQDAALVSLTENNVDGVLLIPIGFGDRVDDSLVGGQSNQIPHWQIKLMVDPKSIKKQYLYQLLQNPISHLMSAVKIAQLSSITLRNPADFSPALEQAWEYWQNDNSQSLVRVEQLQVQEPESVFGDNPYNQASPGAVVQFTIMGLVISGQILVHERKSRTLQRLMTTALKPWEILVGHLLAIFFVVFLQTMLLIVFGQLILDVNYLHDPGRVLLVAVALGLWVSSMGLLIGLMANEDDQVILYTMIAMFVFSGLGGAWIPLEMAGTVFATLGKILPSSWAMTGFQNVLIHRVDILSTCQPVSILLAFGVGFFVLSVWRFRTMEV